jgi:hypothetical protein
MFGSANKTWKWQFWYWRQIWFDCEQQSENTKSILLWLKSDQEFNRKGIEDFLLFPTSIHTPSYDLWFKRYALSNVDECCWNAKRDRFRGNGSFWIFLPWFKIKTLETWNAWCIDILLRFPMNVCMSHADKPSNGYDLWKTIRGKIFNRNLETDWVFEGWRRSGLRIELRQQIEWEEDALRSFLIGLRVKPEWGTLDLRIFSMPKEHRQGRTWSERYEGLKDFL